MGVGPAPFVSPLRYPGGKRKLLSFFTNLIDKNSLRGVQYAEPYAGGAGLALRLLFDGLVSHIHLNDLDRSIYAFWYSVLYETERFCQKISSTRVSVSNWRAQQEIQKMRNSASLFDLGFSTFFLNRTNRSGILKAGLIGGKKQLGEYKLNVRFNKKDLIRRIQSIATKRESISISNLDGCHFLDGFTPLGCDELLLYLDPPYFVKGKALYENHFLLTDHENLSRKVKDLKNHWVVSYDNVDKIREMYSWCAKIEYSINYTAQNKVSGLEIMFFSPSLSISGLQVS